MLHCTLADCSTGGTTTAVDFTDDVGCYTSSAIGTDGFPVISYWDVSNGNRKVYTCTATDYSTGVATSPATVGIVGRDTSIAIGADNIAVISHYDSTGDDLEFVRIRVTATGIAYK